MTRRGFLSADRVARRDHLRGIIRRAAAASGVSEDEIGRRLGYSRARWRAILTKGELACVAVADLVLLSEVIGSDAVLEAIAEARGYRLVRELTEQATPGEMMAGAADTMRRTGVLVQHVADALPDGIDPIEAREIGERIKEARRSLADLEARLESSTITPIRSTR